MNSCVREGLSRAARALTGIVGRSAAIVLGLAVVASGAFAVTPQVWSKANQASFEPGRFEHLSLADSGDVQPAPIPELLFDGEGESFVWSIARTPGGELFAGTAPHGKLWRGGKDGKWRLALETGAIAVTALASGPDGTLYAASMPGGLIHVLPPGGAPGRPIATGEQYVWALAMDGRGDLIAATGLRARVLRFRRGRGKPELLLDSPEEHLLCLLPEADGSILAGSSGHGLLYKIPASGPAEVILDVGQEEIRALVRSGSILHVAAVTGLKTFPASRQPQHPAPSPAGTTQPSSPPSRPNGSAKSEAPGKSTASAPVTTATTRAQTAPAKPSAGGPSVPSEAPKPEPLPPAPTAPRNAPRFSRSGAASQAVYAVGPTGIAVPVFSSDQEVLLAVAGLAGGGLAVGTGNTGHLFRVAPDGGVTRWLNLEESQILSMLRAEDGSLLVGTANPGRLYRIDPRRAPGGLLTTEPLDAGQPARWGRVSWRARGGGALAFSTRSGNSEKPDATWSDWSKPLADAEGSAVASPAARYLQARVELRPIQERTPVLESFKLVYQPRNAPPSIEAFEVATPPVDAYSEHREPSIRERDRQAEMSKKRPPSHVRRVRWEASDSNRDRLWAMLHFRGESDKEWKPLLAEPTVSSEHEWDTRALPDGAYTVRLTVGDSWSNPAGTECVATRESERFTLDTSPPILSGLSVTPAGPGAIRVTIEAVDTTSNILTFEMSMDGGDWIPAPVSDGLADSRRETMELPLSGVPKGEHTIAIRSRDEAGNVASARSVVEVK